MSPEQVLKIIRPAPNAALNVLLIVACIAVSVAILLTLNSAPSIIRRWVLAVATFDAGLFYSVEFFIPHNNFLSPWITPLGNFLQASGAFLIGMGLVSLCSVHGKTLLSRKEGWINSLAFFISLIAMLIISFWQQYYPLAFSGLHHLPTDGSKTLAQQAYAVIFEGAYVSLDATIFSLLAFFIVSAAYRAFRVKTGEATLMMVAAFICMLGQVGVGQVLTNGINPHGPLAWFRIEHISHWLLTVVNAAAFRGIAFGTMIGFMAIALRMWLSLEQGAYFDQQM